MATVQSCSREVRAGLSTIQARTSIRAETQTPPSALVADPLPPPSRSIYTDPEAEALPWTGLSLLVALAGLFLLIAFPGSERAAASARLLHPEQELEVVTALAQFRRALVSYRADQGAWPGAEGDTDASTRSLGAGDAWQAWFERHVSSDVTRAGSGPLVVDDLDPLVDFLPAGRVPVNVVNGLHSVRVLLPGERMPQRPDGSSGWILDPRTGDLRVNALGRLRNSGQALFDL